MKFTSDELILALISLVRATRPAMLRQEKDGVSVDFEAIAAGQSLTDDDRLLLKMRAVIESPAKEGQAEGALVSLALEPAEGRRLAQTLERLEKLQPWQPDVLEMSRSLRARLTAPR